MTEQAASYRQILRSSSVIGGASVVNILIGLARVKVLAVLLGPTGVGLVALYRALMTTGTTVATMGIDIVGARQVAEANAQGQEQSLAIARRAIFWNAAFLACVGALVMWSIRAPLARHVLGDASLAGVVGWLSLGVAFSVAAAALGSMVQGMRRIGDIARISVYGSLAATVAGILFIWRLGYSGLVPYILIAPVASFVFGWIYVTRIPKPLAAKVSWRELPPHWKMLLRVGVAFMGGAVATTLVQLWIRVDVAHVLGAPALGQFQASWTISQQYIAVVLGAMAADYYPRLTGVVREPAAAARLVNEQTEIALLLSAPIFLAMMGLAPWVLRILYTADFTPAVGVLRWQVLADVLKVASWPLGFIFLAAGDGKTFFWTEITALLVVALVIAGFLRAFGLDVTGIAYLVSYAVYLPLVYWLAKRRIGFTWSTTVTRLLTVTLTVCAGVGAVASQTRWGALVGCLTALLFAIFAFARLSRMSDLSGPAGRLGAWARRLKIGRRAE